MKLPQARTENLLEQNYEIETLIYDLVSNRAFNLNETLSVVYKACGQNLTFDELRQTHNFTDNFIYLALDKLDQHNLLIGEYVSPHSTVNRREVIRRIGLTSMIALPVISALIAPTAVDAQSLRNLALGQTCTSSSQCSASAPNCANRSPSTGIRRCCTGAVSYYDTGGVVNSCSGGSCSSATFACQADANQFCCSNSATASCTGNSCACRCN